MRRPYHDPASPLLSRGFSVRIEHDGAACYFPLGENDSRPAAKRARDIYLSVLRAGWKATCKIFPRELTVAMHWAGNPVAWTYATLYTRADSERRDISPLGYEEDQRQRQVAALRDPNGKVCVAVIEPDAGICQALARCIERHVGFSCVGQFGSTRAAFARMAECAPQLVIANHHQPDMEGPELVERL
ncbi:MAG: response regulator, partial [Verrucomicrobia subdivision 3 bacterium]|nr:response regulator [Limisphaerales bacterium]